MTDELKYIILNNINGIRMGLHDVPSGSLFLAWDENLAKSAAYEASFCRRNASYYSDYSKR